MTKITYEDKEFLNKNENVADKNKVNDTDLNQIKEVVNENDENLKDLLPVVLFSTEKKFSDIAVNTIITLNDSVLNYKRLVVYGISNNNVLNSCEVYKPLVNNVFELSIANSGSRSGYYAYNTAVRPFTIQSETQIKYGNGTALSSHTASQSNLVGFCSDGTYIKIYAVIGFKN